MRHLHRETHPIYDDVTKFGTYGIWEPPPFDVAAYQKRIDAIAGTSLGKPIVRLVWAWDKRCREAYYTKWDFAGNGTQLEFGYRYRVARIPIGDGDTVDICPPRWLFEQRFEPGQYALSWERSRWAEKDVGRQHRCGRSDADIETQDCDCPPIRVRAELKPPPPEEWYNLLWSVASHDPDRACCDRLYRESRRACWGYYRLPNDSDLQRLRRAVKLRDEDTRKVNPHEPMSDEALADAHRAAFAETELQRQERSEFLAETYRDIAKSMEWRIREQRHSKRLREPYHLLQNNPLARTKSGLYVPKSHE